MAHGVIVPYAASITTNAKLSNAVDLKRSYDTVYLQIPTMVTRAITGTCAVYIQASADNVTFARVNHPPVNTSTSGINVFEYPSTVSSIVSPMPNGLRYVKIETANTMTVTVDFNIICADM